MKIRRMKRSAAIAAITILTLLMGTAVAPIASAAPGTSPGAPIR